MFKSDVIKEARMEAELKEYQKENAELRQHIMALQGEVYSVPSASCQVPGQRVSRQVRALGEIQRFSKMG